MTSTLSIWNDLAPLFEALGGAGVIVAALASAIAGVAIARNWTDTVGIITGIWLVGVLLSACAGYSDSWWPMSVTLGVYPAALLTGGLRRIVVLRTGARAHVALGTRRALEQAVAGVQRES